jgi:hypothetical protein
MHGISPQQFAEQVGSFLGPYYIALAVMNGVMSYYLWQQTEPKRYASMKLGSATLSVTNALVWLVVSAMYVLLAAAAVGAGTSGNLELIPQVPDWFKAAVDWCAKPYIYTGGTTLVLAILYLFRGFFVQPWVAWTIWNLMFLFLGLSMPDPDFYAIVAKPDNVPIVAMVFLLAFFTWLAAAQAVENDRRRNQGLPPREKENDEKVLVWPDLVYTELVCMIALSALLILWAIALQAPLEEPASSVKTPNPSKAPWYFLGLQEMLVYYDPWMAGVVLPSFIIVGLMAIPYIDFNKAGNGYYTINERRFAYITFQLGFLELWVTLIVLGTLLRGPNWNFFGPYELWDAHKVEALNNVNLSEYFWQWGLGMSLPKAPIEKGPWWHFWDWDITAILLREWMGIVLVLGYFIAMPPLMAVTFFRGFYQRMGFIRYMTLATLLLFMASLPIKMILRWVFNLKYIVAIPEYFLNF